ncbi:MAG: putative Iron-regulated protein precursor [Polyangiaceae bacterium]|nr:putative Iron-regulated protein precursor [Polyangiaceae bacterium]
MIGFGNRRVAIGLTVGLVVAAACTRTEDPVEHYRSAASAGTGTGGTGSSTGGKGSGTGSTGGKPTSTAGTGNAQGGEDDIGLAGAGGEGSVVVPQPPTDFGCGEPPISSEPFTRKALRAAAAECAQWHYCRLEGGARGLVEALDELSAAPSEAAQTIAREAYAQAFALTSVTELFQFGPYASQSTSAGKDSYQGKGYREVVYSWPLSSRCRVEEQVAQPSASLGSVLVSARGLFGLDYLLHYSGTDTECNPSSAAGKKWATLSEDEIAAGKLDYAVTLGNDILSQAQQLRADWSRDEGNFAPQLVNASGYPTEHEAMKVMAWSLLYMERDVKDWKLGLPTAHTANAPVSVAEAAFSGLKIQAIRQNLIGFRGLYEGCGPEGEGLGFDDWLTEAGHPELAQEIIAAYVNAQALADAAPQMDEATPAELEALYQAVKRLTDLLKNDLFGAGSPIGLTLPPGLEGDTD